MRVSRLPLRAPRPEDEPGAAEFQQWLHEFMEGTRSLTPEDFQDMKYDATYDWVKVRSAHARAHTHTWLCATPPRRG